VSQDAPFTLSSFPRAILHVDGDAFFPFRYNIDSYNRVRGFFNTLNDNVHGRFRLPEMCPRKERHAKIDRA